MTNSYAVVSGLVFGVVSVAHIARAFAALPVQLGTYAVPVWVSWAAAVVAGGLCVWAFRSRS
jgi:hypothetical protein